MYDFLLFFCIFLNVVGGKDEVVSREVSCASHTLLTKALQEEGVEGREIPLLDQVRATEGGARVGRLAYKTPVMAKLRPLICIALEPEGEKRHSCLSLRVPDYTPHTPNPSSHLRLIVSPSVTRCITNNTSTVFSC